MIPKSQIFWNLGFHLLASLSTGIFIIQDELVKHAIYYIECVYFFT
jgi:hypothetical protein